MTELQEIEGMVKVNQWSTKMKPSGTVKDEIMFEFLNPLPSAELYQGFDKTQINVVFVGKSGTGKSSLVKAVICEILVVKFWKFFL